MNRSSSLSLILTERHQGDLFLNFTDSEKAFDWHEALRHEHVTYDTSRGAVRVPRESSCKDVTRRLCLMMRRSRLPPMSCMKHNQMPSRRAVSILVAPTNQGLLLHLSGPPGTPRSSRAQQCDRAGRSDLPAGYLVEVRGRQ